MRYGIYYNYETIGDTLIIEFKPSEYPNRKVVKDSVVALYRNDELVGINILDVSKIVKIHANGFIPNLNVEVLKVINYTLKNAGIEELPYQEESGFKIAKIIDIEEHPDSEHLHICKVDIGEKEPLQIVCGAYNARKDLVCVCATPYSFMPDGKQIIPNKLLKIDSYGMLCSGRELHLEGYENKRGLLELDDSKKIGEDFFKINY